MGRFRTLGSDEGSGGSAIPDLINGREAWTAEIWSFWFIYIAPHVLGNRFANEKYYNHMCELIAIMKTTLQFEISRTELEVLRGDIISWVERYEEYYYQYDVTRLSTCLLVVHGLLHVVDDILNAGPIWATWTFFMERFCGHLKRALRSRVQPWAHLDRRATNLAHAAQLQAKYDLQGPFLPGRTHPLSYLSGPRISQYQPGHDVRQRISRYLAGVIGSQAKHVAKALPDIIPAWGKVRIGHGGDTIRAMIAQRIRLGGYERNNSFVRYETLARDAAGKDVREVYYGELQAILECPLDDQKIWGEHGNTTCLLALIRPCKTNGEDAAITTTTYREVRADVVVDLQAVQAVVGRVRSRNWWGIIDRSTGVARTVFVADESNIHGAGTGDDNSESDEEANI
ncbi:hypothetical protein BV20DRAFT_1037221 [Pilatotrama ljubarskyi]|nr:hypothetical protein BV20DRAFT_1037221 [Pilatotrama ljubarskyi]